MNNHEEEFNKLLDDPVVGQLMVCDLCKHEYTMDENAAARPLDPLEAAAHDLIPSCPKCRDRFCGWFGIFADPEIF